MRRSFQKVPLLRTQGNLFVPLGTLDALQSQDVLRQLPPPFPLKNLKEMIP